MPASATHKMVRPVPVATMLIDSLPTIARDVGQALGVYKKGVVNIDIRNYIAILLYLFYLCLGKLQVVPLVILYLQP